MKEIVKIRNLKKNSHLPFIFSIFQKYDLDFIPKIIEWDDTSYTYEYVDGLILNDNPHFQPWNITQKSILQIKIAMDDIWKKLYHISLKELKKGHFLWHDDLHVNNVIWKEGSKGYKLVLIDIDSFCISKHVPICYLHNHLFGIMEEYNRKKIMDEMALFGNEY